MPSTELTPLRAPVAGNLRLFLGGQAVAQCGTWVQFIALGWLGYQLTGSATALGWVTAATFGPLLVLGPWLGAVIDRCDTRRVLLAAQCLVGAQAAGLGMLVLTGTITVPLLYLVTLAYGLCYAVENPARHAIVAELVEPPTIPRAVSLASATAAGGRVLGPVTAGLLLAWSGLGWCFAATSGCYLLAFLLIRRTELVAAERITQEPGQVVAGLRYAWRERELRIALLLTAVVTTFGFNHQVVVPLLAEQTFDGGAGTYTLLYSAINAGAVLGALGVARRIDVGLPFLGRAALAFAVALGVVAVAPTLPLAVLGAALTGVTGLLFTTAATALLQTKSAPAMRGRVMALAAMVVLGGLPVGGPVVGVVADLLGPRGALGAGALIALVAALTVLRPCNVPRRNPPRPSESEE